MQSKHGFTGRADIHMHTTASDGFNSVQEVLQHITRMGTLDVIAITDHDEMSASLWAYEHRDRYPFDIIPGVEVSSADGHVLALWVTKPINPGMSLAETVAAIHEQDGIAIVAHPFELIVCTHSVWRYLTHPEVLLEAKVDAVEVHNAGAFTPGNNWLARRLAFQLKLPVTGNSDGHTLAAIGRGVTYFDGHTAADFRQSLLRKETAVEGMSWPIIDYWKLLPNLIQSKFSVFSAANTPSTRLIRP
ncbi:MAG: CehA/McbA family metallohydrolase [Anaerolineae bacterium]|nr:CehA/McbA family metallohydrolase [Anaerolineae bacterium]